MFKLCALMLLGLGVVNSAQAGLFSDEDTRKLSQDNRKEIQQLEARVKKLEAAISQQTGSMLDLQSQIEVLGGEIRKLRGQNEELVHSLGEAEKRAKDFYVDLDTRLRNFESSEEAGSSVGAQASGSAKDPSDPAFENRAFEAAYGLYREGKYADAVESFRKFLNKYPESVHVPNAIYWLGTAKLALKDYKGAMSFYKSLLKGSPNTPKAADAMLNIAECQQELKQVKSAKKTLKGLVAKYPSSEAAAKAKKLLAGSK